MEAADLLTVRDMAMAVGQVSGGNITAVNDWALRDRLASQFGAPIFAIKRLAPELLERPAASILFGNADWHDVDGGRWLTLYARTLGAQGKITFTLCTKSPSKVDRRAGKLLLQAAQPRVVARWHHHLAKLESKPDLLMLLFRGGPRVLDDGLDAAIKHIPGRKVLVGCTSHVEAVIIEQVLRAHGFACTDAINFPWTSDQPRLAGTGAWWLCATVPMESSALVSDPATLEKGHELWAFVRDLAKDANEQGRIPFFEFFGQPRRFATNDGATIDALMIDGERGVDTTNGTIAKIDWDAKAARVLSSTQLSGELIDTLPGVVDGESENTLRFRRMAWAREVAQWLGENEAQSTGQSAESGSERTTEVSTDRGTDTPPVAKAEFSGEGSHEATEDDLDEPTPASARPHLSRGAGKVDVLAFAGVVGRPGHSADQTFNAARELMIEWLRGKGFNAPPSEGALIELSEGELAIESDGDSIWSFRLDDRRTLAQAAMWRVEVALLRSPQTAIGVRLSQVRRPDSPPPSSSGVPSFVVGLAERIGLSDARIPAVSTPSALDGERGAKTLIEILSNPSRTQSVVVSVGGERRTVLDSLNGLARRLVGVAIVVHVDQDAAECLRATLGPRLGIGNRAIRIYASGLGLNDEGDLHPWWRMDASRLSASVADEIFETACAMSLRFGNLEERVPSFQVVKELLSQRRVDHLTSEAKSKAISAKEKAEKYLAIREELQRQVDELRAQLAEGKDRIVQLENELRMTVRERQSAHDQVRALQYQLNVSRTPAAFLLDQQDDQPVYPDTWDELEQWVESYGQDRLVVLNKAAKAARKSPFLDIPLAYKALDYLARFYVPMKTRSPEDVQPKERADQFLAEHGLEDSPVGDALEDRRYKSDYECIYLGKTVTLDRHLKKGGGFDASQIFRLYFYYDSESQKVVVGHLPTHLTNRATHSS